MAKPKLQYLKAWELYYLLLIYLIWEMPLCNCLFGFFEIPKGLLKSLLHSVHSAKQRCFFVIVLPTIRQMFVAWFTFETERPDESIQAMLGDPGHRWLTAFGPYSGNSASLTIEITSGGVFDSVEPAVEQVNDGTLDVEFDNCEFGTISYNIPSLGLMGMVPIERIVPDGVALCEALSME